MRILLTGSNGQVGQCFKDRFPEDWELIASDSKTLDITDEHSVLNMAKTFEPDIIVNTAGYTAVDKAEDENEEAFNINAIGTLNLALAAKATGARFIHLSSDQVFDGIAHLPNTENTPPNPQSIYGKSKLAGELLALNTHIDTLIIRSSWIYSEYGNNFVKSTLQFAQQEKKITVINDQIGCPTYAGDLAEVIIQIAGMIQAPRGILHYAGTHQSNWVDYAAHILELAAEKNAAFAQTEINPVGAEATEHLAKRPYYAVLNSHKIHTVLKTPITETPLKRIIDKLLKQI